MGGVQGRQDGDQVLGALRHLVVVGQDALERFAVVHAEAVGVVFGGCCVGRTLGGRSLFDEIDPALLHQGHVLDEPTQAQRAGRGALGRLCVGEAPDGVAQEPPVLGQGLEQVSPLGALGVPFGCQT